MMQSYLGNVLGCSLCAMICTACGCKHTPVTAQTHCLLLMAHFVCCKELMLRSLNVLLLSSRLQNLLTLYGVHVYSLLCLI